MLLTPYLPLDRYLALAQGRALPEYPTGAALFVDISGFTPLTERLARELGPRRGGEELTGHLNAVYDALIGEVTNYRGSILFFSGDALTCWFEEGDNDDAVHRATTAALALQQTMRQQAQITTPGGQSITIEIKVAVAAGPARRFMVGDPAIQRFDILAGATLERLSQAEHLAKPGEVVVAAEVVAVLSDTSKLEIKEWRKADDSGAAFAVITGLTPFALAQPWPPLPSEAALPVSQLREWLLPSVFKRLEAGLSDFLTELRPATALFLRFAEPNYDNDPQAGNKLDQFLRRVQSIVGKYEGNLLQVTIGDKGSYLYCAFGAPIAHQNDTERAIRAGLDLLNSAPELAWSGALQIGISQGLMRTGSYGGTTRHTYGVLGDEVNLAARLMQAAQPGQILVSQRVRQALAARAPFEWKELPPLRLKGKAELMRIYQLLNSQGPGRRFIQLSEPTYKLPIVGRESELAQVKQKLEQVLAGQGQIVAIVGEAGSGKSRLLAEITRLIGEEHPEVVGYGGECQSFGTNSPYLVWQPIFREFFGLNFGGTVEQQIHRVEQYLARLDAKLLPHLPLLGPVLNLTIPDNEVTGALAEKQQKEARESLLIDCIRAAIRPGGATEEGPAQPLLLMLEDCHWLDSLSHELLEALGKAISNLPVLVVMAYRPTELEHLEAPHVTLLPHTTQIFLNTLTDAEQARLIELKSGRSDLDKKLVARLIARAEGNPFYLEELLNYLRDKGLDLQNANALDKVEWPDSLHSLVLSRIDRLSESEKGILKIASIIGRVFKADWIWEIYPAVGSSDKVINHLSHLARLDITPLDKLEPELEYLFKHAVTQEVAYESQPAAARQSLHRAVACFIEERYQHEPERWLNLLAFHFLRGNSWEKVLEYSVKAGDVAQQLYAWAEARRHYGDALEALTHLADTMEHRRKRVDLIIKQSEISFLAVSPHQLLPVMHEAEKLARSLSGPPELYNEDRLRLAVLHRHLGTSYYMSSRYQEGINYLRQTLRVAQELRQSKLIAISAVLIGQILVTQGYWGESIKYLAGVYEQLTDDKSMAYWWIQAAGFLGVALTAMGDYGAGLTRAKQSYTRAVEIRNATSIGVSLAWLCSINTMGGHPAKTLELCQRLIEVAEQSNSLVTNYYGYFYRAYAHNRLGQALAALEDMKRARSFREQMGGKLVMNEWETAVFGEIYLAAGQAAEALALAQETIPSARLSRTIGAEGTAQRTWGLALAALNPPLLGDEVSTLRNEVEAHLKEGLRLFEESEYRVEIGRTHLAWGKLCLSWGDRAAARQHWQEAARQFETYKLMAELEQVLQLLSRLQDQTVQPVPEG